MRGHTAATPETGRTLPRWGSDPYQQIALGHTEPCPTSGGSPASLFQVPSSWDPRPTREKGRKQSGPFT